MTDLVTLALVMYFIQLVHSLEELKTGFHKKWWLFKMPFKVFLTFEIVHNTFWGLVILLPQFPLQQSLINIFVILMLLNGIQHIIWSIVERKYVPGLVTAPLHIISFLIFYFRLI